VAIKRPTAAERIVRNPRVLGGEPIIRGTRITVRSVILALREYDGQVGLLDAYPRLTPEDAQEALAYYEAHMEEIERYLWDNLTGC
jgi:uncharacterized protein (DUF433 family)